MLKLNRILKDFYILNIVLTVSRKGMGPTEARYEIVKDKTRAEVNLDVYILPDGRIYNSEKERERKQKRERRDRDLHI